MTRVRLLARRHVRSAAQSTLAPQHPSTAEALAPLFRNVLNLSAGREHPLRLGAPKG